MHFMEGSLYTGPSRVEISSHSSALLSSLYSYEYEVRALTTAFCFSVDQSYRPIHSSCMIYFVFVVLVPSASHMLLLVYVRRRDSLTTHF